MIYGNRVVNRAGCIKCNYQNSIYIVMKKSPYLKEEKTKFAIVSIEEKWPKNKITTYYNSALGLRGISTDGVPLVGELF